MAFISKSAVPVTLPIATWSQRQSEIITRDFDAVAAGSSSISKELFSQLLELHLSRQPTPAEVASVTRHFGETGLQLADWSQWAHPAASAKQPYVWDLGLCYYGSSGMGYKLDEKHFVELQGFVADVTTELQKKGIWDGVTPGDVTVKVLREGIGSLTPPEGQAVVLKLLVTSKRCTSGDHFGLWSGTV